MMLRSILQQVFQTKYLSSQEEFKIRQWYPIFQLDDIDALIELQQALNSGYVQREATNHYSE